MSEIADNSTRRRNILLFCASTGFFWASLYLYVPILPVYSQSLGASLSMVGIIISAYAIPQLLFRIPIGILFDIFARRKLLLALGMTAALLGALGLGLAPGPWALFLARALTGLGAAGWVMFTIYFTAYYPPGGVQRAIGIINFVQGGTVVAATLSGGFIAEAFGSGYTFWGAALLGLTALVTLSATSEPDIATAGRFSWHGFAQVASRPLLIAASVMGILAQFANWSGLFGFIPVYGAQIGASKADLGIISMLALGSSAVTSLFVARFLKRLGCAVTIALGGIAMGGSILVVPFINTVPLLQAVMLVNGVGRGTLITVFMVLSVQAVAPSHRATAMGVYQATYALGMFLGPIISGFIADRMGLAAVFYLSSLLSFAIVGIACLSPVRKCDGRRGD